MIHFIAPEKQLWIIQNIKERVPRDIAEKIQIISYDHLHRVNVLNEGALIFTGINILSDVQRKIGAEIWGQVKKRSKNTRLMNHPENALTRYELLKELKNKGLNDFDAFRIDGIQGESVTFPVFIREEKWHTGSLTGLIYSKKSLERDMNQLEKIGYNLNDLLVVEFCDTSDENGLYRKYSALKLGDAIMPRYLSLSHNWIVKENEPSPPDGVLYDDDKVKEERNYITTNPHKKELESIFDIAKIDYGRIDYAVKDGKIQTWEINTHPTFGRKPGVKREINLEERIKKRTDAKKTFYEAFRIAFRQLEKNCNDVNITITVPKPLYRKSMREQRGKNLARIMIRAGKRIPRFKWIHSLRSYIKGKINIDLQR